MKWFLDISEIDLSLSMYVVAGASAIVALRSRFRSTVMTMI